jgi:hypothetical protein
MLSRIFTTMVVLLLALNGRAIACLRTTLDSRAIQWSTLIVQARLTSVAPIADLTGASTKASPHAWRYQTYIFNTSTVLDGSAEPAGNITVIRFVAPDAPTDSSECAQDLTTEQLGKSFVLLLLPESTLSWTSNPSDPDPRTAQIHALKAFIIVHLESADDLGLDGLADLKSTISDTRSAEAQVTSQQARTQAIALSQAADGTEADQAEHTLLEMGPKALDAIKSVLAGASDIGRARLARVIKAITPTPLSAVQ